MPLASEEISVPAAQSAETIAFIATAVLPHGDPLSGANLELHLEGDGSFHPSQVMQEAVMPADMNGEVYLTWYPYPPTDPARDLKSTLSVVCDFADCLVIIQRQ